MRLYLSAQLPGQRPLLILNDNPPQLKDDLDENEDNDDPL